MQFSTKAIALWCVTIGGAAAFSTSRHTSSRAFVVSSRSTTSNVATIGHSAGAASHAPGCDCGSCNTHGAFCVCSGCRGSTALFAAESDAVDETPATEVPEEVAAMDGVESEEEAHNVDRPARAQLKKKRAAKGKPLSEFEAGTTVTGKVRSIATYGAFIDIGAATDGLLHISQLASGFVASVADIVEEGQELEVRIVNIDADKGQIALSLISEEEAAEQGQRRDRPQRQSNRRDDNAVISSLESKGWDKAAFIEGTVVSVVDFGAFVRLDASTLNAEVEGEMDGLVHISSLAAERVRSVSDIVNVDDKIQIRLKGIDGNKVSLTALSVEQETNKAGARNDRIAEATGAKDWAEQLVKIQDTMPSFQNVILDPRK